MSKGDESDSADDEPEGFQFGKSPLFHKLERKQMETVVPEYNPKSSQAKKRKKKVASTNLEGKLGRIALKSRSKDTTSRKSKVDSINLRKSRTEKERAKARGSSLRSTGFNWKNKKSRSKQRNKSLR